MQLSSNFASHSPTLRSDSPLSDDQIRRVAPSIFADSPHESRSERYAYIPTAAVLAELRKEGFEPFMAAQTRVRHDDRRDYTKHMLRLRHASQINGAEANDPAYVGGIHGRGSGIQEGRRGQGRTSDAELMMPVSAGGHLWNAQPEAARSSFWRTVAGRAMMMKCGRRLLAIVSDAARSGFLSRRSYVAPSPRCRHPAKRPKLELNPRPI